MGTLGVPNIDWGVWDMLIVSITALLLTATSAQEAVISNPLQSEGAATQPAPATVQVVPSDTPHSILTLRKDTPVELMATSEISTATAMAGTKFKLRLNKPIEIEGGQTIPVGTWAHGEVTGAKSAGGLGKSGVMTTRLSHLQFGDAAIPLDGETSAKGTGAGSAGVAVVLSGVIGLFHRGNNAKIKAGEIISAFVAEDVAIDFSGTTPRRAEAGAAPAGATAAGS